MRPGVRVSAVALGSAMFLAGCAQTFTAAPGGNVERVAEGKYDLKVFGKGPELYEKWDAEAKRACSGAFKTENQLAGKSADGQDFLTGRITCLPAKK